MKKLSSALLLLHLLLSFTVFSQTKYSTNEFEIEYPEIWKLDTSQLMGTAFIIISPAEKDDKFGENFNLVIQELPTYDISLDDYVKISEKQIIDAFGENSIIESKTTGNKHNIIYKANQKNVEMIFNQIYILKNNKAYILTFTALPSSYNKYKDVAQKTLNSFSVK
jgi:serine/threonine-protein kinase